jgi:hypothetical protein
VEPAQPDGLFEPVPERLGHCSLALLTQLVHQAEHDLGRPLAESEIEPDVWAMALAGCDVRATDVLELAALDQASVAYLPGRGPVSQRLAPRPGRSAGASTPMEQCRRVHWDVQSIRPTGDLGARPLD